MTADELPSIPRPLARGGSRCHVLAVRQGMGTMVAACGVFCGGFCGDEASFEEGVSECPVHAEEVCSDCCAVVELYARTGEWEGAEGDLLPPGMHRTVCFEPRCPEIVESACWCFEHLSSCPEPECGHAAHLCDAAVHYCDDHAPEHE